MTHEIELIPGTSNVFADAGDPDAETKHLKALAAAEIIRVMRERSMTVRAAAEAARVDPADVQRIRNADLARFSLDRLLRIAHRLGRRVQLRFVAVDPAETAA